MTIHILAPETVCKIAAGEVVERPASVVKELVENSLDAGATQVNIEVKGGGTNLIRVSDNGTGIPSHELETAFQQHATSKINGLADLQRISSLGFRGEALASIAHVAVVEVLTRCPQEESGTFLRLQEGRVVERAGRAHHQGSTFTVRSLFRNVPARLKYLRSPNTENLQISNLVGQYSLAFPLVRFSLVIDGRQALQTPGSGKLRDVLAQVYNLQIAHDMLEIDTSGKQATAPVAGGYVSPISVTRATRGHMTFFVNRRWIQSRLLARAVEKAYEGLLGVGRYPIATIYLTLPPDMVDVNVHPAKREVRFAQESVVFNTVYGTVRRILVDKMPVPEIHLEHEQPVTGEEEAVFPAPFEPEQTKLEFPSGPAAGTGPWLKVPLLRVLGQSAGIYIVAEGPDGLYLIDQHAAHERVVFEKVLAQRAGKAVNVQALLEPMAMELTLAQEEVLQARRETLGEFGFDIEPFGERACLLRAVPALMAGGKLEAGLKEILDSMEAGADPAVEDRKVAISIACHSAIRAGQALSYEEMRQLVRDLERASSPRTCPHGRPTMVHLSAGRLEKEFGRS